MADHLCVLIHGLWGNPKHFDYFASALRERFAEDQLQILVASRNSGSFTYDGIQVGGERVTHEIEETLLQYERDGKPIRRISIVGYSLGGLVSRYAVGLLYHKGWFKQIKAINFTTFATPHLGVRTPLSGYGNHLWNVLGARTLSMSGRQLFLIDSHEDSGRPLISLLADPDSVFVKGLASFQQRSLYANIVNDRNAAYYTTCISPIDPFTNLDAIDIQYETGYDPVILKSEKFVTQGLGLVSDFSSNSTLNNDDESSPRPDSSLRTAQSTSTQASRRKNNRIVSMFSSLPTYIVVAVVFPFAALMWFSNSAYQSARSSARIRAHRAGRAGIQPGLYNIPLVLENVQRTTDRMYAKMGASLPEAELSTSDETESDSESGSTGSQAKPHTVSTTSSTTDAHRKPTKDDGDPIAATSLTSPSSSKDSLQFPTLALTPQQFAMIDSLDAVGFEKHLVHIHLHRHSHAAIIVRKPKESFAEGKVVARHWIDRFALS